MMNRTRSLLLLTALIACALAPAHSTPRRHPPAPSPNQAAKAMERLGVHALLRPTETIHWSPVWTVTKWNSEARRLAGQTRPDATVTVKGNKLCTAGITRIWNLLVGAGGQALNATHCRLLAGDTGTAPTAADTDLNAAVNVLNRYAQILDGAPSVSGATVTFTATFGSSNGNFHWLEEGTDAGTASGATAATAPLLNHANADLGTKSSGSSWTLSESVTLS